MPVNNYNLITILGPTASGKTTVAAHLAAKLGSEIISADSRQVYRGMDIGTGKDLADYTVNGKPVPYHLINIVDAGYKYSVFEYQRDFLTAYNAIVSRGITPILCGGTGMYIDAVVSGYELLPVPPNPTLREQLGQKTTGELIVQLESLKTLHNNTDTDSRKRLIRAIEIELYLKENKIETGDYPEMRNIYIGIDIDRETRRRRITERLHKRLDEGMVDEVQALLDKGIPPDDLIFYGLEYKYLTLYLQGKLQYNDMVNQLNTAIHQFAKRQMTWFRGMERKGAVIHWIDGLLPLEEKLEVILDRIRSQELGIKT